MPSVRRTRTCGGRPPRCAAGTGAGGGADDPVDPAVQQGLHGDPFGSGTVVVVATTANRPRAAAAAAISSYSIAITVSVRRGTITPMVLVPDRRRRRRQGVTD